jgi:hypothetical protein
MKKLMRRKYFEQKLKIAGFGKKYQLWYRNTGLEKLLENKLKV